MEDFYSNEHLELAARLKLEPDDPLVFMTLENLKLGEKVGSLEQAFGTWSTAIVNQSDLVAQQTRLIVEQNTTLQATAKNYSDLSTIIAQFSKETSEYALGLNQLNTATNSLAETSSALLNAESVRDNTAQALSLQMSKIEAGAVVTAERSQKNLDQSETFLSKVNELIEASNVSRGIVVFYTLLSVGLCFGGYFVGHWQGVDAGKWQIAHYWFDGFGNLDYWKQLRNGNQAQVKQCIDQGRTECTLKLP